MLRLCLLMFTPARNKCSLSSFSLSHQAFCNHYYQTFGSPATRPQLVNLYATESLMTYQARAPKQRLQALPRPPFPAKRSIRYLRLSSLSPWFRALGRRVAAASLL